MGKTTEEERQIAYKADQEILAKIRNMPCQLYTSMFILAEDVKDPDIREECERLARRAFHIETM